MNAPDLTPTQTWGEHRGDFAAAGADYFTPQAATGGANWCPTCGHFYDARLKPICPRPESVRGSADSGRWTSFVEREPELRKKDA